ncbi:hypothetical protein [Bradyrhizobium sp. B024]|uniref:Uncharacterized protein n=1 Tax=Bradyrhizobium diazoefficiens TaxID=1355477 RepID=A0A809Y460_9BRAD|nr:hypothetical protein [Bradyrhizobium japonicum]BCE33605.1 hypothetical protein XF2B_73740 [Bradyrhizobium diazoefficiens]BCE77219.1 hypothetical protein XF8B_73300 [Bradyrhizobium diazoefficiens]BCF20682.1 hypothetical protein XF13B_73730 [Bradyrhizobium diazoefficiens]
MSEDGTQRRALDTAWTLYLSMHDDVDPSDARRCLLEPHLQRSLQAQQSDTPMNSRAPG